MAFAEPTILTVGSIQFQTSLGRVSVRFRNDQLQDARVFFDAVRRRAPQDVRNTVHGKYQGHRREDQPSMARPEEVEAHGGEELDLGETSLLEDLRNARGVSEKSTAPVEAAQESDAVHELSEGQRRRLLTQFLQELHSLQFATAAKEKATATVSLGILPEKQHAHGQFVTPSRPIVAIPLRIKGLFGSAELDANDLTLRAGRDLRVLPLTALSGAVFEPAAGMRSGYLRVDLVASWVAPAKPAKDINTIQFSGSASNIEWQSFAFRVKAAIAGAVPKRSLAIFSHHAGSGWVDSAGLRKPDPSIAIEEVAGRTPGNRLTTWAERLPSRFCGLEISGDTISYRGQVQTIRGAHAFVDAVGGLERRISPTRVAAAVMLGMDVRIFGDKSKKTVDTRGLCMTVNGELYSWAVVVGANRGMEARTFAAKINTASKH
ncbi:hypothetical protein [Cryobacterium mannosilyticum]|nr:hypothetical protein [Cryobacterium mannosilyticum]